MEGFSWDYIISNYRANPAFIGLNVNMLLPFARFGSHIKFKFATINYLFKSN